MLVINLLQALPALSRNDSRCSVDICDARQNIRPMKETDFARSVRKTIRWCPDLKTKV